MTSSPPVSGSAGGLPPGTLRVSMLAQRIQTALKNAFPRRIWLVGETAELERSLHKPHWFFRLVEKEAEDGKRYALGAVIWQGDVRRLFGPGGPLHRVLEPKDGIEIRVLVDIDFYAPNGDMRLVVREIDPAYTLGKMALERQQLIEKLTKDGTLARQKELVLAPLPLRIGLISSENSAAYNDFVQELSRFSFAFQVVFFDARMQGEDTVATVSRGIRTLARRGVDAIAIVRGGGSTMDLAWFDKEPLVRVIGLCRIPILTGIGHEIDTSVADLAAHRSFKTPTAVAAFFNECASEALDQVRLARDRLLEVRQRLADERETLAHGASRLLRSVLGFVREEGVRLRSALAIVTRAPRSIVASEAEREAARLRRLVAIAGHRLAAPERERAVLEQRLASLPLNERLLRALADVRTSRKQLTRVASDRLRVLDERHATAATRLRLLDPRQVVARGFAILRDRRGRLIADAASLRRGDAFQVELRDGALDARVLRSPNRGDDDGTKEDREDGRGPRQLEIW